MRWPKGPGFVFFFVVGLLMVFLFFCFLFVFSFSSFCFFSLVVVFFVSCFLFFVFGGFKGQVRWPKGPPHLALNPPLFACVFLCFPFFEFN